jgi:hypothetical protein
MYLQSHFERNSGLICLFLITLLLLISCSGKGDSPSGASGWPATLTNQLTALPALTSLPELRAANIAGQLKLQGDQAQLVSSAAAVAPTAMQLNAEANSIAFAIYGFALGDSVDSIEFVQAEVFDVFPGGEQYLAISDFARNRWDISPVPAAGTGAQALLDSATRNAADYLRADGVCFIAVLTYDQASITVDSVTLGIDGEFAPPDAVQTNGSASLLTHSDRIEISWSVVALADGYDLYMRPASAGPQGEFVLLVSLEGNTNTSFSHTASEPPAQPCPYNEICEYKLKSRSGAEESLFSNTAVGLRTVPPPQEVTCAADVSPHGIEVKYSGSPGATEFLIYRDELASAPIAITDVNNYFDDEVDFAPHLYFVRASCPEGQGLFATQSLNQGRRLEIVAHNLLQNGSGADGNVVSMAVVGGRPAFAFSRSIDTLGYACATESEPGSSDDWQITNVKDARIHDICLVEHAETPWIIYSDILPNPAQIGIARSTKTFPSSNGEWTSYELFPRPAASAGVKLIEADGLLRALLATFKDDEGQEGEMLYAMALESEPVALEWDFERQNTIDVPPRAIDLALIGERPTVLYSASDILHYASTEAASPQVEDWDSHILETTAGDQIRALDLSVRSSGLPAIGWVSTASDSGFEFVFYRDSAVAQPQSDLDWLTGVEVTLASGATRVKVGEYLGRPFALFVDPTLGGDDTLTVWQFLSDFPSIANDEFSRYEIRASTPGNEILLNFDYMEYVSRPVMLLAEKDPAVFETFPRYVRYQAPPAP